jgi:hypothetical protein
MLHGRWFGYDTNPYGFYVLDIDWSGVGYFAEVKFELPARLFAIKWGLTNNVLTLQFSAPEAPHNDPVYQSVCMTNQGGNQIEFTLAAKGIRNRQAVLYNEQEWNRRYALCHAAIAGARSKKKAGAQLPTNRLPTAALP